MRQAHVHTSIHRYRYYASAASQAPEALCLQLGAAVSVRDFVFLSHCQAETAEMLTKILYHGVACCGKWAHDWRRHTRHLNAF